MEKFLSPATVKSNKYMVQYQSAALSWATLPVSAEVLPEAQWTIYTLDCYHTCHFGVVRDSHAADVVVGSSRHLSCTPCPVAVKRKAERPDEPQLTHVLS